ncbi:MULTISPECIES: branched-chain amino acid ABC transporter permease [unclassified Xanthobacter]|uniref:branched-chain amino acid ABC transporter permease n=1 Tax=unclassified Xanthobacter TaxID=2623496 RepID=UPI001EE08370|nr:MULTISPECIES: branched-chain amino acid ABC transporter permease [unclassified Xanthobacter]
MRLSSKQATLLVLAVLILVSPAFFPSNYYYRVGAMVFVNAIAVVGIAILTGYAGQISLGHAGFVGIGGYACALMPLHFGVPPLLAVVLGATLSGVIAWLVGRPILRLKGYYLAVASLGFGVLVAMVLANEGQVTGGPDGIKVPDPGARAWLTGLGLELSNAQFWYVFTGLFLLAGAWLALNLNDSATGRALRALHGSEVAARTVGVDVARAKLMAFVISAVYASVAGSLLALQNRLITPDVAGYMHSIELVTMAVLGGAGSVLGAILGAALLTLLPQVLTVLQDYEHVVLGLVMMAVMIFLPAGLLPSAQRFMRGRGE